MGAKVSALSPASSSSDLKKPKHVHQLGYFPKTEQQAKAEYINILKEMEYRSVRAAKMAYEHSDEFEKRHIFMTKLVSIVTYLSTLGLQINGKTMGLPLYFRACSLSLAFTSFAGIGFYQYYDKLLPLYHDKHVAYNKAGARWQALEFKIRFERATSLQNDLSLEDLRKKGLKYAEDRRKICEIARPTVKSHDKYEENYSHIIGIKEKLNESVAAYFEVANDSTAPADGNIKGQETIAIPEE